MTNTPKLKPCPFCGGAASYFEGTFAVAEIAAGCGKCEIIYDPSDLIDMDTHNDYELDNEHELAAKAWNTRTTKDAPTLVEVDLGKLFVDTWAKNSPIAALRNFKCPESYNQALKDLQKHGKIYTVKTEEK